MIKTGLIGFGAWGKILYRKMKNISEVEFVCGSDTPYVDKLDKVNWVVIATPDTTHYTIVKDCLLAGKDVFCEKPLSLTYLKSKKLFDLAEKKHLKLYVDDIEKYKEHKVDFLKYNFVERKKVGNADVSRLLYILAYHDIYLLHDHIKNKQIKNVVPYDIKDKLHFKVEYDDAQIEFLYTAGGTKKIHYINDCNLSNNNDALSKMLTSVFNSKANFNQNKETTLFVNSFIDSIKTRLYGEVKHV